MSTQITSHNRVHKHSKYSCRELVVISHTHFNTALNSDALKKQIQNKCH